MGIKENGVNFSTKLTVREVADAFQELAVAARSGMGRLVGGVEFGRPTGSDDPFADLDEAPVFSVYAHCPRNRFNKYGGYGLHLYVYERGSHRDVVLARRSSTLGDIPSAETSFQKVLAGFRQLDPELAVTS